MMIQHPIRHSGESRNPVLLSENAEPLFWTPAFAGVTTLGAFPR